MKRFGKKMAAVMLSACVLCSLNIIPAAAETCQTVSYGNHWRESEFRPYNEDGEWGANYILSDSTKAKVLLFFSRTCDISVQAVRAMSQSAYLNHENVEIEFIDTVSSSKSAIQDMVHSYGLGSVSDKIFYSPTSYPNQTSMWDYVNYSELKLSDASNVVPVTIILDGDNKIRYARDNMFFAEEVDCVIGTLLGIETQEEETVPETVPETQAPETQAPETQAPEIQTPETQAPETVSENVTLYFMTGSTPDEPGEVFAQFEVPKNARKNVSLGNTINTLDSKTPQIDGKLFTCWKEGSLTDASKLGNQIYGVIWTNETDQYIYAQYKDAPKPAKKITLYFMTGSSPDEPGEVFAQFEVAPNTKGKVSLNNTINTLDNKIPQAEGKTFAFWKEGSLTDASKLGNRIYGVIWTPAADHYIYAQYN